MIIRALIVSMVVSGGLAGSALAQDQGSQADQDACTPDVFRLCQAYIPNEDPIVACLKSKKDELSPPCRHVFFSDPPPPQPQEETAKDPAADNAPPPHKHPKPHGKAGHPAPRVHHRHHPRKNDDG